MTWDKIRDIELRLYHEFLDNIDIKGEAKEHTKVHWLIDKLSNKYTDKFKEQYSINEYDNYDDSCLADFIEEDEFVSYLKQRYPEIIIYEVSYNEFQFPEQGEEN